MLKPNSTITSQISDSRFWNESETTLVKSIVNWVWMAAQYETVGFPEPSKDETCLTLDIVLLYSMLKINQTVVFRMMTAERGILKDISEPWYSSSIDITLQLY